MPTWPGREAMHESHRVVPALGRNPAPNSRTMAHNEIDSTLHQNRPSQNPCKKTPNPSLPRHAMNATIETVPSPSHSLSPSATPLLLAPPRLRLPPITGIIDRRML